MVTRSTARAGDKGKPREFGLKISIETVASTLAVADGGWSTQLIARGLPLDVVPETANLTHGHLVAALARDYMQAGVEILTTNTFAANAMTFARRGIKADVAEVNKAGVTIARNVAQGKALVAGVIGPTGVISAIKDKPDDQVRAAIAQSAAALSDAGADWIVLETFSELAEILLAINAVREACNLPIVASMSFDSGPQRARTHMGVTAEIAAATLSDAGAEIIGCNCGGGIATVLPTVVAMRAHTKRPLWVKPSAGPPDLENGLATYSTTADEFGGNVAALLDAGASIVGGCCGIGPEHVRRVAALIASRRRKK